jgi:phosphatidylglycerol---prolipoprotein diacylglyceryl transferase
VLAWASAGALARLLYKWRLAELASPLGIVSVGYALSLAAGAAAGAWIAGSLNTGILHPSHSIAGGLAGGIVAVELWKASHGVRQSTGAFWVGPLALGIAIGRIGCFLAGLPDQTYGIATSLPWGVDFGDGIRRHPVQLYESATMLAFLGVYLAALARRAQWTRTSAFYVFVLCYAVQRFVWEFLKPYPRVLGPLDVFQLLALAMIGYALLFDARARRQRRDQPQEPAVDLLRADDQPV